MRRVYLAGLVMAVAMMTSGCYEFRAFVHGPFGPGTLCDMSNCGCCDPCGCGPCDVGPCGVGCGAPCGFRPTWGCGPLASCEPRCMPGAGCGGACGLAPDCGPACGDCGPACGPCGDPCGCDPCGCDPCGYGGCTCGCCGPGPIRCVLSLLHPVRWFGCYNNGCGEMYWGDFHGDPPDCCDPCDCMGNYTGCTSGGCGCSGEPTTSYGTPGNVGPSPQDEDPSRAAQPTKAPTRAPAQNPYYSGQRQQNKKPYYTGQRQNQKKNPYYTGQRPQYQQYPSARARY
ncbi:MAG TPA: hypothetical protein VJL29_08800 [Thermoguttaceae bacterium]|nr:hypothetical protein [Thermoguttaceae bacterium]